MPNRFDERKGGNNKMKKRMLSTLLTLGMLLTLTPAVSAEVPEGSAGDIPEETCKVEYKEQSDGIEIQTEKDSNNIIHLDITINETCLLYTSMTGEQ